jgi:hypothetical protein
MPETQLRRFVIAHKGFELDRARVEQELDNVLPDPLARHFVVINGRRYPPKQVICLVTGLDRADFTSHQARRVLLRLGFPCGRVATGAKTPAPEVESTARGADALRPFIGRWVATRDDEVLVAADEPREVVAWLARHGQKADSMFRVPENELAMTGLAPL